VADSTAAFQLAAQLLLALGGGLVVVGGLIEGVKRLRGVEPRASSDVPVPKWFVYVGIASFAILGWIAFA
jgi:hypothetical protein